MSAGGPNATPGPNMLDLRQGSAPDLQSGP